LTQFILGLHAGHNAGACIGKDGRLLFAVQEERLNGEKNYWGYPRLSIESCLNHAGIDRSELASVAYGGFVAPCKYHRRDDVVLAHRRQESFLGRLRQRYLVPTALKLMPNYGQNLLAEYLKEHGLGQIPRRHFDHHRSHAASAYYGLRKSPHEKYLVLTCDGEGDGLCATVRVVGGGEERLVASTPWDSSLGAVYSWVTYLLGFVPLEHEYKLMGMAPYASEHGTEELATVFRRYLGLADDGLSFRRRTHLRTNDLCMRMFRDFRGKRFDYICAGLQRLTEELLCEWTAHAVRATGVRKVLAAGGVFMNVKANKRISELPEVDYFEAFPSCGDETLCFGAYYLEAAARIGDAAVEPLQHFYLGDAPESNATDEAVRNSGYRYQKPDDMAAEIAAILASGQPLARCDGPMEYGARALGNRSILADPKNQDVVRIINQMVKKRDFWMPFAPMMLAERHAEYVRNPKQLSSPYMMMTFDSRDNFREMIAAVHNADLTCRAQLLEPHHNPSMHAILKAFEAQTGRGVILNTSFNLHGYPIVRTAADALHVFRNSGLPYLQVGDYLVSKN
jgi:carbamoyltransferase